MTALFLSFALLLPLAAVPTQDEAPDAPVTVAEVQNLEQLDPGTLDTEVLATYLRPMTAEEAATELERWLGLVKVQCEVVRDFELRSLAEEDPARIQEMAGEGLELRTARGALIERAQVAIDAVAEKGGDVASAQAYVDSVAVAAPITGWRAALTMTQAWVTSSEGGIALLLEIGRALGVLVAAWLLAKLLGHLAKRAMGSVKRASDLLSEFVWKSVYRLTMALGLLVAVGQLGISINPFLAALGAAGLVIGLALQGTLGNIANGIMIMVYRPFDVGDLIKTGGQLGKVQGMTLMTTTIMTLDNQVIHVPNNMVWGDVITNVTASSKRRVDMLFGIGYGDDVDRAMEVLDDILRSHDRVLSNPEPVVRVHELGDSSVNFVVRPWVATEDYWDVHWDVTKAVKQRFDAEGISIPFPQRDVHLFPEAPPESRQGEATTPQSVIVPTAAGMTAGDDTDD